MGDLSGKTVLVTRSRTQASQFVEKIQAVGGRTYVFPVIETITPQEAIVINQGNEALLQLEQYDWIFFTSVNGVEYFFKRLDTLRQDYHLDLADKSKIVAVGPATGAALEKRGVTTQPLPEIFQAEGLLEAYGDQLQQGQRVLLPRGNLARPWLHEVLADKGLQVTEAVMYETVPAKNEHSELLNALKNQQIDIITFTSSSTVKYFLQALSNMGLENPIEAIQGVTIACIGPVTAQTAQEVGLNVTLVSKEATLDSLLEVISN